MAATHPRPILSVLNCNFYGVRAQTPEAASPSLVLFNGTGPEVISWVQRPKDDQETPPCQFVMGGTPCEASSLFGTFTDYEDERVLSIFSTSRARNLLS